jgi:hypothetical protein
MKVKKTVIWSIIHSKRHISLGEEGKINDLKPISPALFPGIEEFSTAVFRQVLHSHIKPVLKKLFPELIAMEENSVESNEVEITEFLPSDYDEWKYNPEWQEKFNSLLNVT